MIETAEIRGEGVVVGATPNWTQRPHGQRDRKEIWPPSTADKRGRAEGLKKQET